MSGPVNEEALSRVAASMRPALREYGRLVEQMAAEKLAGLTVFGLVLEPDFDPTVAGAASVVVLQQIDLTLLRRLAEHGPDLGASHLRAPLIMTPAYIAASLDTFPLEMLEIHQRRATLLGEDCFASLPFKAEHVRLQCEREFKRILIGLRQGLLAAAGREQALSDLHVGVGGDLLRTLRGMLWLKGLKEAMPRAALLEAIEQQTGGALPGIGQALTPYGRRGWEDFVCLYEDVEKLAKVADEL